MQQEVVVRGSAEARALPDRAIIRVEVDGEGSSREDAYRETARHAAAVDEVVGRNAEGIDRNTTAALVVHPKSRWRRGESVRTGWRGSRTTLLEVTDFARLGDLFADLAAAGGAVAGPYWHLDPTNAVHAGVRRLAAEDARARAGSYAAALGLRIDAVAWIAEPGLRDRPESTHVALPAAAGAMSLRSQAAPEEVIDVVPEEMTVAASVEVGFTFVPADS